MTLTFKTNFFLQPLYKYFILILLFFIHFYFYLFLHILDQKKNHDTNLLFLFIKGIQIEFIPHVLNINYKLYGVEVLLIKQKCYFSFSPAEYLCLLLVNLVQISLKKLKYNFLKNISVFFL